MASRWSGIWTLTCSRWIELPRSSAARSKDCYMVEMPMMLWRLKTRPCRPASHRLDPTMDRAAEDLGNSIHLEHVNVQIPDQRLAMLFYVTGLGLTRDPYLMVHDGNMWINVGRSQFHLPTGAAQVL